MDRKPLQFFSAPSPYFSVSARKLRPDNNESQCLFAHSDFYWNDNCVLSPFGDASAKFFEKIEF